VKYSNAKVKEGPDPKAFKPVDLAIPMFGYKNHLGIYRAHGLIRTWDASAANARRSVIRPAVEHVFAGQKHRMGLIVRTIGIARVRIKISMANLAYNFQRLAWLEGRTAPA
jgi:transposase, IS5 family